MADLPIRREENGKDECGGWPGVPARGVSASLDRVPQGPEAVDLDLDDVPRPEPDRRGARHADAGGRAGEDQVAWLEGEDLGEVGDHLVDPEDELGSAGV